MPCAGGTIACRIALLLPTERASQQQKFPGIKTKHGNAKIKEEQRASPADTLQPAVPISPCGTPPALLLRAKHSQLWAMLRGLKDGRPRKSCPVVPIAAFIAVAFTFRVKARQRCCHHYQGFFPSRVFFLPGLLFLPEFFSFQAKTTFSWVDQ